MIMIDPICKTSILDTTLFEQLTSQYFNIETFKPFLCEVMKLAGIDNIDSILHSPEPFDFSSLVLNFSALTGVGDPRISLGHVLSAGFEEFFPLALAQVEVIRSGGCRVIDGYICDSDGNKRKKMSTYCPPNFTLTPITSQQIALRTSEIIIEKINDHASKFSNYIKTFISDGWTPTLFFYEKYFMFYVKLVKNDKVSYIKYYPDSKDLVANNLQLSINHRLDSVFDSPEHYTAMISEIPEYY